MVSVEQESFWFKFGMFDWHYFANRINVKSYIIGATNCPGLQGPEVVPGMWDFPFENGTVLGKPEEVDHPVNAKWHA